LRRRGLCPEIYVETSLPGALGRGGARVQLDVVRLEAGAEEFPQLGVALLLLGELQVLVGERGVVDLVGAMQRRLPSDGRLPGLSRLRHDWRQEGIAENDLLAQARALHRSGSEGAIDVLVSRYVEGEIQLQSVEAAGAAALLEDGVEPRHDLRWIILHLLREVAHHFFLSAT
jgi:hypothetical protein